MGTFITVPREIFEDSLFVPEPYSRREAFLDLVQKATHEPKTIPIRGGSITVNRGQLSASIRFLATRWQWSCGKVESVLKEYESVNLIERKSDSGTTLISIVNYDFYQKSLNGDSHADRHANEHANKYNNNKDKEVKEPKEKKSSNDDKERFELAEKLYAIYPTKCPMRGTSTGKSSQDKKKIASLLKDHTYEELESTFKRYVDESLGKAYLKNFSTFLNNLPDYTDSRPSTQGDLFAQTAQQQEAPAKQKTVTLSDLRGWYQEGDPEKKWQEKLPYIIQNYENNGYTIIYDEKQHNPTRGHTTSGN